MPEASTSKIGVDPEPEGLANKSRDFFLRRVSNALRERPKTLLATEEIVSPDEIEDDEAFEDEEGKHSFVIAPGSLKRVIWDLNILLLLLVVFVTVPLGLAFGDRFERHFVTADLAIDSIFLIDVLLNFVTGFRPDGNEDYVEMRPKAIAKHYLSTWFIPDVVSCPSVFIAASSDLASALPAELSLLKILKGGKTLKVLKLFKMLKMLRISKMLGSYAIQLEEFFMKTSARIHIRLSRLLALVCLSGHLLACLWLVVSDRSPRRISWMYAYRDGFDDDGAGSEYHSTDFTEWGLGEQYITAVYFAITTMSTVGFGDICPSSTGERLFMIAAMVVGGAVYGYIIASLASVIAEMDTNQRMYYEKMDMIHSYMKHRKFPPELRSRVHRHFRKFFEINSALDEKAIFNDLSESLRLDVMAAISNNSVTKNYLFRGMQTSDVGRLSMLLKPSFVEGHTHGTVIKHGDKGSTLFVITSGVANCYRPARKDENMSRDLGVFHCVLVEGDCFGELVGLGMRPTYNVTVVCASEEGLEMLMLSKSDFLSVFPAKSHLCNLCRVRAKLHSTKLAESASKFPHGETLPNGRRPSLIKVRRSAGENGFGVEASIATTPASHPKKLRRSLMSGISFRQTSKPSFLGPSVDGSGMSEEEKKEYDDAVYATNRWARVRSKVGGIQVLGAMTTAPAPPASLPGTVAEDKAAAGGGGGAAGGGDQGSLSSSTPTSVAAVDAAAGAAPAWAAAAVAAAAERRTSPHLSPAASSDSLPAAATAMLAQVLLDLSEMRLSHKHAREQADARTRHHQEAMAALVGQVSDLQELVRGLARHRGQAAGRAEVTPLSRGHQAGKSDATRATKDTAKFTVGSIAAESSGGGGGGSITKEEVKMSPSVASLLK